MSDQSEKSNVSSESEYPVPKMTLCITADCTQQFRCRRSYLHHGSGIINHDVINPTASTCQSYYPFHTTGDQAVRGITQEPMPSRKVSGVTWTLWKERHGNKWIICASHDGITHIIPYESLDELDFMLAKMHEKNTPAKAAKC